jgi:serine/threonine protein kinase
LAERFVVRGFISKGGTARVYEAWDELEQRAVALKIVQRSLQGHTDDYELECSAYRRFKSRHLPELVGSGDAAGDTHFMALDLLRGRTLDEWLRAGPLGMPAVVDLGRQLLTALVHAHTSGVVHCDIKPRNIVLHDDDNDDIIVKLIDFGTCAFTTLTPFGCEAGTGSRREHVVGTPAYMCPERMRGERVDFRSDVYSAAVVLYESITGRVPFAGPTSAELMQAAQRDPIVPPRVLRESCPIELERVLMRALCKNPSYRYTSARLMADALTHVALRHGYRTGRAAWQIPASVPPPAPTSCANTTKRVASVPRMPAVELRRDEE